jgi:NDP-hexose-3-ketoreductase
MSKRFKIGILGFANIAKKYMIPAIEALSDSFELVAIASSRVNNYNDITFYDSYDKLLNNDIIEAVYIPLPNALHFKWAKYALEKGMHVIVEKSMCCTHDEVLYLNKIASENECVLFENFQFRFHSQLDLVKKLLNQNEIGSIRSIISNFGFPPFEDPNNIRYKKELGGGALLDAGVYPIKLSQELLGYEVDIVNATLNYEGQEVDIWGDGKIKQINGNSFLHFSFGFDNYYQCSLEILGTKGKITTNRIFTAPPDYTCKIIIEKNNQPNIFEIPPENQFVKSLLFFLKCIEDSNLRTEQYHANITQSSLVEKFKIMSNVK